MKVLFIHRSVGQNFLNDANVRQLLPGIAFHDLNANTNTFTNEQGIHTDSIIRVDSGNTNPDGLAAFFAKVAQDAGLQQVLGGYDVIAFKSCYTANQFKTDQMLDNARAAYNGAIREFIQAHPSIMFLIISPPPRRPLLTNKAAAQRAKLFAGFLSEFAAQSENVRFYDLFNLLADNTGRLKSEYRRWLPVDQHPNYVGSVAAGQAFVSAVVNGGN